MDLLLNEIQKKRSSIQEKGLVGGSRTFFKRAELNKPTDISANLSSQEEKKRTSNDSDQQIESKRSRTSPVTESSQLANSTSLSSRSVDESTIKVDSSTHPNSSESPSFNDADSISKPDESHEVEKPVEHHHLSRDEMERRLRERDQPVRLFGETDADVYARLQQIEAVETELQLKGLRNDFKTALDQVDEQYLIELMQRQDQLGRKLLDVRGPDEEDATFESDRSLMMKELGKSEENDQNTILRVFRHVLALWARELNDRSLDVKVTFAGRMESARHKQTVEYIEPLFNALQHHTLDLEMIGPYVELTRAVLERDYIRAHNHYVELAIGNAPWPIGVTNHGIHRRTAQERIHAKNLAHVLNDEVKRKYIQATKRLMTQAQIYYPTDPHRSVNFRDTPQLDVEKCRSG